MKNIGNDPRSLFNGNHFSSVIGLVSVYICTYVRTYVCSCHQKKIVIERTRDLIYLKFLATDFFLKIISPSAGENSGLSVTLAILQFLPC